MLSLQVKYDQIVVGVVDLLRAEVAVLWVHLNAFFLFPFGRSSQHQHREAVIILGQRIVGLLSGKRPGSKRTAQVN